MDSAGNPAPAPLPPGARVLITGAGGFVGRHLRAYLSSHEAQGGTVLTAGRRGETVDVILDLGDGESIDAAVAQARPDIVFHLAGEASVAVAGAAAAATWRANVGGSLMLALALGRTNPDATMLFTSSVEVYGRALLDGPVDETARPAPVSTYGKSKLAAELMLGDVLPATAALIVARPSNHIGPGQDARFALPSFAAQLVAGERAGAATIIRVGNLATARDFMDVRDVVRAYAMLAGAFHASRAREVFNIASGTATPVRALLDAMRAEAKVPSEVEVDPERFREEEVETVAVDAGKLVAKTGWRPEYPLARSIRDLMEDCRGRAAPT